MDRPEPGLVRWSPNPSVDSFLHFNIQHGVVQLYEPTGHAQPGRFDYRKRSRGYSALPPLTTYDWSPCVPWLVAVGTGSGMVNLVRIDDGSNGYLELGLKMTRTCQAVAFNTQGLLAVGLDRVRSDQCLHIWDVSRLSKMDVTQAGFSVDVGQLKEPERREAGVSVSSIKFFEDNPNTLAVGIKGQGVRIHDLRDSSGASITFQTKCNNNLAIDYADQNYFASSTLDQPGIMIWDRRATSRHVASESYIQAVDVDDVPWGGALRLDQAIDMERNEAYGTSTNSYIRVMRYSRDHRGMLAVLSRSGQLKVLSTHKEFVSHEFDDEDGGPELLEVRRSHEMDHQYMDPARNRIVSFDWINLRSPVLRPRMLVLRASGDFEVIEQPSFTSDHLFKLVPWSAPYRGLEEGTSYHGLMQFEPPEAEEMLGPLVLDTALSDIPLFGKDKADVASIIRETLESTAEPDQLTEDRDASHVPLPEAFAEATTIADKIIALLDYPKTTTLEHRHGSGSTQRSGSLGAGDGAKKMAALAIADSKHLSSHDRHEKLIESLQDTRGYPREAQAVLDHIMLLRAKEKYLFDYQHNSRLVKDNEWLSRMWDWICDAEAAVGDSAQLVTDPIDFSYMGVYTIWMNDPGSTVVMSSDTRKFALTRVSEGTTSPDEDTWEHCLKIVCGRRKLSPYDGVPTERPYHRRFCLDIASWGDGADHSDDGVSERSVESNFARCTMATAHALFRGETKQAVRILKQSSARHPELLFVSLALQLASRGDADLAREDAKLDFDDALASRTDPYLRAISSYIATAGDWLAIANQSSLPLKDRVFVALRHLDDATLTRWLETQMSHCIATGDVEGIVLAGITERLVDVFAQYVASTGDFQTATLVLSICCPRYVDDYRAKAWRNAYRAYLQRHRAFFARTKFEVESTKRSKRDGRPTTEIPSRQISLRCIYCESELAAEATTLPGGGAISSSGGGPTSGTTGSGTASRYRRAHFSRAYEQPRNPLMTAGVNAGASCPMCGRHLPRCVVCLEVVGVPRTDSLGAGGGPRSRGGNVSTTDHGADARPTAAKFPTFCLRCEHVLHLDHARQWFARHVECPVPECRCRCNFRANPELAYH